MSQLYLEHFGLNKSPFKITPDLEFFFAGGRRGDVLSALLHVAASEEGIITVVAEVGSGKTLLSRLMISRLDPRICTVYLANPVFSRDEILSAIARDLGLQELGSSTESKLAALQGELLRRHAQGQVEPARQVRHLIAHAHRLAARLARDAHQARHGLQHQVEGRRARIGAPVVQPDQLADHDARMDRLLWLGATAAASRQLAYTSPDKRAVFAARLAMRNASVDAAFQGSAVESANPSLTRTDAGYITDKATWLRKAGRVGEARALLAAPRALAKAPTDTEEWLETLLTNARQASEGGDKTTAYNIARQLDDAFPAGTVIRETPLGVRDDYTSLAWLAGQLAYRDLRRPAEAVRLYRAYGEAARSAQTRTKGFYWAGRAALAAGDRTTANAHFADAAQHYDQFYGQLALERLSRPQPRPTPDPTIQVSNDERRAFEDDRLVRAARALGEIGAWREQSMFLRALAQKATSPADHVLAGKLASQIGRPDLGVMIGRSAQANSLDAVEVSGFPTVRVPAGHEGNWTFIHAITRQESQFDRAAISHAGARGMMQLMPGTAREVAGKLGMSYDAGSLTTDTNYNMMLGSTYFQQMLRYFGGSYPLAVAAYNAGPGNVNKWLRANGDPRGGGIEMVDWIEAIPIFETRNYVQRVLENAVVYDTLRDGGGSRQQAPLSFYLGKRTPG